MTAITAAHSELISGEIFSPDATTANAEKIAKNPENKPVSSGSPGDDVTLISKECVVCHAAEKISTSAFLSDLEDLTKMQLRKKYHGEATCHRNMLDRSKKRGNTVHPDFHEFRNFLRILGPMPASGVTLDRIDNDDREYAPGKVRWADRRTQNNNKGDTLTFFDQKTDAVFTSSRLAKRQGVSPSTIRKRLERGWSDAEIIAGEKKPFTYNDSSQPQQKEVLLPRQEKHHVITPYQRTRTAKEIAFERMAEDLARHREEHGVEGLPASHHDINEILCDGHVIVTEQEWLNRYRKMWPDYRPHIIFDLASPYHQKAIEKIDPEYVSHERKKAEFKASI